MREKLTTIYPFFALLIGLILTQILASVQVYISNAALYDNLLAIKKAGYLTIPHADVMSSLQDLRPALYGGLFFTFSIGAGISFFTLAIAWIWSRIFSRSKYFLYACLLLWPVGLAILNIYGFNLFLTLIALLVPPTVFAFVSKCLAHLSRQGKAPTDMIHILPIIVLGLLLSWQIDSRMFTDFRDIYLLSNPIGARINDFYYRYTLYPAEVFKSLDQKMLKTGMVETNADVTGSALNSILLNYDYIPVEDTNDVDLKITATSDSLHLESRGNPVMQLSSKAFFADPNKAIREFEKQSDTDNILRQMTFISLLFAFPLAVYVIAHGLISIVAGFFLNARKAALIASGLCFAVCVIMFFTFQFSRGRNVSATNLHEALSSKNWQTRVGALKIIDKNNLEINQFISYPELLISTQIAERYWLVRTLGNSKSPATYNDLLLFLNDPHPNVRTMAIYATGKRGGQDEIDDIMQVITTSDNWYTQWYAYKALRSLGWRQVKLK